MRQETQGVTETLIKNATEEFLEYGFTKASLRRIAGSSGVSTNSIYTDKPPSRISSQPIISFPLSLKNFSML